MKKGWIVERNRQSSKQRYATGFTINADSLATDGDVFSRANGKCVRKADSFFFLRRE